MADELPPELEEAARQFARQLQGTAGAMSGMDSQAKNLINTIASGAPVTREMLKQLNAAGDQAARAMQNFTKHASQAASSFVNLYSQVGRGNDGFKLLKDAIDVGVRGVQALGDVASGIAGKFLKNPAMAKAVEGFADVVGGGAEIFGDVAKYMVDVYDDGINSFIRLSKVGGVASDGIQGVTKNFDAMGLPMAKYQKLVESNSKAFAAMGGTVARTAGIIANELGALKTQKLDQDLRNLGMSSEEIADTMVSYADLQRMIGNRQYMDSERLRQGTLAYGKELDEIARLTGMSREEAAKAAEEANRNARYLALQRQLEREGKTEELANLRRLNAVYKQHGLEKGFQDMATGMMNTQEAIQLFNASQGQAYYSTMQVKNGLMGVEDALKQTQTGVRSYTDGFGNSLAQAAGNVDAFGNYGAAVGFAERDLNNFSEAVKDQEKAISTPNQATENLMKTFVSLEEAAAKLQSTLLGVEGATSVMKGTAELVRDGSYMLSDAIKGIQNWSDNGKQIQQTQTDSAELMRERRGIQQKIKDNTYNTAAELQGANARLDTLNKMIENRDRVISDSYLAHGSDAYTPKDKRIVEQLPYPEVESESERLRLQNQLRKSRGLDPLTSMPGAKAEAPTTGPAEEAKPATPAVEPAGPKMSNMSSTVAPTAVINEMLSKKSVTPEGASPAVDIDPVVRELQGMRSDIQQGNENLRTEMSKGNRINANR